jgi:hypothetical protein
MIVPDYISYWQAPQGRAYGTRTNPRLPLADFGSSVLRRRAEGVRGVSALRGRNRASLVMKFLMASPCLHLYELRAKDWSPSLLPLATASFGVSVGGLT